jgi:aldehyde dehydrogenase (NAD+)
MTILDCDRTRPRVHLRIGAERLSVGSGGTFDHIDPTCGRTDATIPLAGPEDVDRAVETAHAAFQQWRTTRPAERRRLLLRLADLIEANKAEFVRRGIMDNATAMSSASVMFNRAPDRIRYYAGFADKISGRVASSFEADGDFSYTLAQPYGVIGVIITWNGPLGSLTMKIPAALAAGNTVVVKPSELTPFVAEFFADMVEEAGFPPGVVNILPGTAAAGARLVEHPLVQKITFTGGPTTARAILSACAETFKPAVLELGGKSANLVFADADLTAAARSGTVMTLGTQAGQGCSFPTRMLVQDPVYDTMLQHLVERASSIRVGNPFDSQTDIGPVINQAAVDRILGLIERAKSDGARLLCGGGRVSKMELADGYYLEPTVFADVDPQSELAQTEVFGPVLAVSRFSTEDEAVAIANGTPFGLAAYIQTMDVQRAHRVAERLFAGNVMINGAQTQMVNRPFGGFGLSGYGKENGPEGLAEFQRVKTVALA